jgi:hypothetical protein
MSARLLIEFSARLFIEMSARLLIELTMVEFSVGN